MEIVQFVSAKPYLNLPDVEFNKVFYCVHGNKEVVVECSEELKTRLKELPCDYFIPRLKDIKKFLDEQGIPYTENIKGTLTL